MPGDDTEPKVGPGIRAFAEAVADGVGVQVGKLLDLGTSPFAIVGFERNCLNQTGCETCRLKILLKFDFIPILIG